MGHETTRISACIVSIVASQISIWHANSLLECWSVCGDWGGGLFETQEQVTLPNMPAGFNSNSERQETDGKLFHRRRVWLAALKSAWIKAACIECPEVVLTGASERWCWHPLKCSDCGTHIGATCFFFFFFFFPFDLCVAVVTAACLTSGKLRWRQTQKPLHSQIGFIFSAPHFWVDKLCEPVHAAVQLKCLSPQKGMITIVAKWRQKEWILVSLWV